MPHLEESLRLEPTPLAWFNLALAYRGARRVVAAIDAFERYLAAPEPAAPEVRLTAIRGEVSGLLRSVARLRLSVTPAAAAVRVDGRDVAASDGEVRVDPGTHALSVEAAGFEPMRREVSLQAGATVVLELQLRAVGSPADARPAPTPRAPAEGRLAVEPSTPNATVAVDGTPRGLAPIVLSLPVGEHRVELRAAEHRPWSGDVVVREGGTARLTPTLARLSGGRGWVLPVAIAGGAAVVTAAALGIAYATRGTAAPTQGYWETVTESPR